MKVSQLITNIDKIYTNLIDLSEYEERKVKFIPAKDVGFDKLLQYLRKAAKHIDYFFMKASDNDSKLTWNDYHEDDETEFTFENLTNIVKDMVKETEQLKDMYEETEESESESEDESESEVEEDEEDESEDEEEEDECAEDCEGEDEDE